MLIFIALKLFELCVRILLTIDFERLIRAASAAAHLLECLLKVKFSRKLAEYLKRVGSDRYVRGFSIAVFAIEFVLAVIHLFHGSV